jgi:hypothetical protein
MQRSDLLAPQIEVIGGMPQTVLKIKLQDRPELGLVGLSLPKFLDRVLIGPCEYPSVIQRALNQLLSELDITNPENKVIDTMIPLRANQR